MVNGIFQPKFEIVRFWNDNNLKFMDLNEDQDNYLDEDSIDMIWYPWLNFLNIPRKVITFNEANMKQLLLQSRTYQAYR